VKSKNRMTDFQRLRRNVLREIHEHSAPHRMLFSYEKMELSATEIWDPVKRKSVVWKLRGMFFWTTVSRVNERCNIPGCGIVVSAYRATVLASTFDGPFAQQPNTGYGR